VTCGRMLVRVAKCDRGWTGFPLFLQLPQADWHGYQEMSGSETREDHSSLVANRLAIRPQRAITAPLVTSPVRVGGHSLGAGVSGGKRVSGE